MRAKLLAIAGAAVLFVSAGANVTPINFSEGADLSNTSTGTDLGSLGIGTNIVSGAIIRPGDRLDSWRGTLDAGLQIVGITLDLTFGGSCTSDGFGVSRNLRVNGELISNTGFICASGVGAMPFGNLASPLTRLGAYDFTLGNTNSFAVILDVVAYSWQVEVAAVSVPETASIAIVGFGLAGLGLAARRRRVNAGTR